jgi:hypothetical protein
MTLGRPREGPPPQVPARRTVIGTKIRHASPSGLAGPACPERQGRLGPRRLGSGARRPAPFGRTPFPGNPFGGNPFGGKPFNGKPFTGLPSSAAPCAGIPSGSVAFGAASFGAATA